MRHATPAQAAPPTRAPSQTSASPGRVPAGADDPRVAPRAPGPGGPADEGPEPDERLAEPLPRFGGSGAGPGRSGGRGADDDGGSCERGKRRDRGDRQQDAAAG